MNLGKAIELAAILGIAAVASHEMPKIIQGVLIAQRNLLKHSATESWGKAYIPNAGRSKTMR